jgi:thioesterase domain-containing protein
MNLSDAELAAARKKYMADRKRKYWHNLRAARFDRLAMDTGKLANKAARRLTWRMMAALGRATGIGRTRISLEHRIDSMWHAYVPRNFPGRLVLFRAEGREAEFGDDATMGWRSSALHGVDVQFVRGTHEAMLDAPYAGHLAKQLLPYLSIEQS